MLGRGSVAHAACVAPALDRPPPDASQTVVRSLDPNRARPRSTYPTGRSVRMNLPAAANGPGDGGDAAAVHVALSPHRNEPAWAGTRRARMDPSWSAPSAGRRLEHLDSATGSRSGDGLASSRHAPLELSPIDARDLATSRSARPQRRHTACSAAALHTCRHPPGSCSYHPRHLCCPPQAVSEVLMPPACPTMALDAASRAPHVKRHIDWALAVHHLLVYPERSPAFEVAPLAARQDPSPELFSVAVERALDSLPVVDCSPTNDSCSRKLDRRWCAHEDLPSVDRTQRPSQRPNIAPHRTTTPAWYRASMPSWWPPPGLVDAWVVAGRRCRQHMGCVREHSVEPARRHIRSSTWLARRRTWPSALDRRGSHVRSGWPETWR